MDDTAATTISEVVSWITSATASAIDAMPTEGDMPLEPPMPPVGGDEMGPDSSEGSYFLVRPIYLSLRAFVANRARNC